MSFSMKVVASPLYSKQEIVLNDIISMRILESLDCPAQSFSARFAVSQFNMELLSVRVYNDARLLFSGKIDSQKTIFSKGGMILQLDARSAGAALLDNQALPCVLMNARISTIFDRFVAPYGFVLYNLSRTAYLPMYTVRAGTSEWDAFVNFVRRAYGVTPHVKLMQVMLDFTSSKSILEISNNDEGIPYTSISHTRTPYNIISKIVLRDENGSYSTAVRNSMADSYQVDRKRYMIPASEFSNRAGADANQQIRRSMYDYEEVDAVLPGIIDAELGQRARVRDSKLRVSNLLVSERELCMDENGITTRVTLKNSNYYD